MKVLHFIYLRIQSIAIGIWLGGRSYKWVAVKHALDVDELECPVRREQVAVLHAVDVQRARLGREGDARHLDRLGPLIADL